jgi:hypothetical protein
MKTAREKAKTWLNYNVAGWSKEQLSALAILLKQQDGDTRRACAEAVLNMDEPLDPSAAPYVAHDICINVKSLVL